ncbi:SDR family oxidoreductase [Photobacterium minamisatsumaniensis]|uniref:SDR family oxidoreductase n=1 Tax=Photobacterium minamisatsumaniensis TaxID=2910233 RepID=UPI003D13ACD1
MIDNQLKTATVAAAFSVTAQIIIEKLIASGTRVVAYGRKGDEERVEALEAKYNGKLTVLLGNLADELESKQLLQQTLDILGTIDAHYHCSGVFTWEHWETIEVRKVAELYEANFLTAFVFGREVYKAMKLQKGGAMVFVSARDTIRNIQAGFGPYMVSKMALNGMVESMAAEGYEYGIKVNAVLPTVINTPVNRKVMPEVAPNGFVDPNEMADFMIEISQPSKTNLSGSLIAFSSSMQ